MSGRSAESRTSNTSVWAVALVPVATKRTPWRPICDGVYVAVYVPVTGLDTVGVALVASGRVIVATTVVAFAGAPVVSVTLNVNVATSPRS